MATEEPDLADFVSDDDWYEPDTWADPRIQLDYQAALGAFIVKFNQLDNQVTRLVGWAYDVIRRPMPRSIPRSFASKVDLLEAFGGMNVLALAAAPIAELRDLNRKRNFLVHGHFDQNPFDGSYVVSQINKSEKSDHIQAAVIDSWAEHAFGLWDKMRIHEANYIFRDGLSADANELASQVAKA